MKDKIPIRGIIVMVSFLLAIVAFFIIANYLGLHRLRGSLSFKDLFLLNMELYLILFLFDTVFIDGFVLAYWRPGFLKLSDEMGRASMREHILKSIPIGFLFGLLLSGIASSITHYLFVR